MQKFGGGGGGVGWCKRGVSWDMCKWLIWGRRVPYDSLRLPKMAALRLKIKLSSMVLSRKTFFAKHFREVLTH